MREIKFRGLNSKNEFIYGLPTEDAPNSTLYYDDYSYRICWLSGEGGYSNQPIKNGTLGQFTGLNDSQGADIYEGDVVQHKNGWTGVIVWNQNDCSFISENVNDKDDTAWLHPDIQTVIGNIHQHPELMEA